MKETCSLDVADRGGLTLEEVGEILNLTREAIRLIEVRGILRLRGGPLAPSCAVPGAGSLEHASRAEADAASIRYALRGLVPNER